MIARQLIADTIPSLNQKDSAAIALSLMQEFGVEMLPVVDDQKRYIGLLTDEAILDIDNMNLPLSDLPYALTHPYVLGNMHIFEVIKIAAENNLSLIPVIENGDVFIGTITIQSLFRYFSQLNSLTEPGAIIVIETAINSYSLSEIGRIADSCEVKILSLYLQIHRDKSSIEITMKLDKTDLAALLSTFERFNYHIIASFQEKEYMQDLKERYDEFMKFMDI
jgi:acetoin utilization protein AcuB